MPTRTTNPPFLNGVPEMLILHLLSHKPMYGYELVGAIRSSSAHALEFGEGCVYPILHRLEAEGLLAAAAATVGGRSRITYRVTAKGRRGLAETVGRWEQIVGAVNRVLRGGPHDESVLA